MKNKNHKGHYINMIDVDDRATAANVDENGQKQAKPISQFIFNGCM